MLAGKLFREPNKWPDNLPGFRDFLLGYWEAMERFSQSLLPVFATALDLPPDYFDRAFVDAQCVLRLSHFPPTRYRDNQFGLAPHTDANFFTVLPQANVEGLYIRPARARGGWIKAPRIPGSFVINAGDMCRRWTNDRFLSTQHLAINLTDQHRYSTPFFYTPHIDWPIACLPTCLRPGQPAEISADHLWRISGVVAQHELRREYRSRQAGCERTAVEASAAGSLNREGNRVMAKIPKVLQPHIDTAFPAHVCLRRLGVAERVCADHAARRHDGL